MFISQRKSIALVLLLSTLGCSTHRPAASVSTSLETPASAPADTPTSVEAPSAYAPVPEGQPSEAMGPQAGASPWTLERDEPQGFVLRYQGTKVARSEFLFWGANWEFAGADATELPRAGEMERFQVEAPGIKTRVQSAVRSDSPGQLVVDFQVTIQEPIRQAIGGGIEFFFDVPAGMISPPPPGRTEILSGDRGFEVDLGAGQIFAVRFDKPMAKVYLERDDPNRIRTFFIDGSAPAGTIKNRMTITLPKGGRIMPSMEERYGRLDASFMANTVDYRTVPVDLSFLNAGDIPAGRHGRVKTKGDKLVFEDGTEARFWGTNVMAYSLFLSEPEQVRSQAKRLAALGYNLVRLHHHDSFWVSPNAIAEGSKSSGVNEKSLAALDYWIKCLHDVGIYVWLDISVQHVLREGDGVPGFDDIRRNGEHVKGYNYFNEQAAAVLRKFGDAYMSHRNVHTGVRYMDDPAVVGVLVTNENDLVTHGAYAFSNPDENPYHHKIFKQRAEAFADKYDLPLLHVMRPWEPGPAPKFLASLEKRYFDAEFDHLRKLGVKAPLVGTNYWGEGPFDALPSLTSGDLLDVHTYGVEDEVSRNPRYVHNYLVWIAGGAIDGMPVTVTEWNTEYPARDRALSSTYMAAVAALQGWDAMMLYGYTQNGFPPQTRPEPWNTLNDPAHMATAPNAALIYRRGDVAPARKHYRLVLSENDVYGSRRTPAQTRALRTLMEQSKVTITLPQVKELDVRVRAPEKGAIEVRDLDADYLPKGQGFVQSDTGQIKRDFTAGVQSIDTPRSQVVAGWLGGKPQQLSRLGVEISTPSAVVALSALDEQPIETSTKLLLSVGAQALGDPRGTSAYLAQPVRGKVRVRTKHPQMRLTALTPSGGEGQSVEAKARARDGEWEHEVSIPDGIPTHWFLLRPSAVAAKPGP